MFEKNKQKGFTLIELLISISVFAVVVLFSTSSILTILEANRKSQSLRSVMDNFNLTLETMTRTIRFAYVYHCDMNVSPFHLPNNCSAGADSIVVMTSPSSRAIFRLNAGRIEKSVTDGASWSQITSPDVTITTLSFRVFGSDTYSSTGDILQPRVIIVIKGYVGSKVSSRTYFNLQTTVSQRKFDI